MRLSDDILLEFEEAKDTVFKNNNGIYTMFNDNQINVIKQYFRWRTRTKFKKLCENTSLEVKHNKAKKLAEITEDATDWVYDGCVDTGYKGGGHCELGHALRYEHYAYSSSLNKQIVFGVSCAADFFGIDPKKLQKINYVQNDTLEEIKLVAFIYGTNRTMQFMKDYYGYIGDLINFFKADLNAIFGDWNNIIGSFLSCGLPLTIPMINKLEYVRNKVYLPKLEEIERLKQLKNIIGDNKELIATLNKSEYNLVKLSIKYISQYIKENTEYRNKCCKYVFKQSVDFNNACNKLKSLGVKDIEKFANSGLLKVMFVRTDKGERIATVNEFKLVPEQSFIKTVKTIDDNKIRLMNGLSWGVTGKDLAYSKLGLKESDSEFDKIENSAAIIRDLILWINSNEFERDLKQIADIAKRHQYLDKADDEINDGLSLEDMIDFLQHSLPKEDNNNWVLNTSKDIIKKHKDKKYTITDKQKAILIQAYNIVKKMDNSDVVKKANIVVQNQYEPLMQNKYSFNVKVAKTVVKSKLASQKQAKIVEEAYNAIINGASYNEIPDEKLFVSKEPDEYREYKANIVDIDSIDIKEANKNKMANSRVETPIGMPSIIEVSNALGMGNFKYEAQYDED